MLKLHVLLLDTRLGPFYNIEALWSQSPASSLLRQRNPASYTRVRRERNNYIQLFGQSLDSMCRGATALAWSNNPTKSGYTDTDDIPNEWASLSILRIWFQKEFSRESEYYFGLRRSISMQHHTNTRSKGQIKGLWQITWKWSLFLQGAAHFGAAAFEPHFAGAMSHASCCSLLESLEDEFFLFLFHIWPELSSERNVLEGRTGAALRIRWQCLSKLFFFFPVFYSSLQSSQEQTRD